jgi:hypothetical protein
VWLVFVWGWWVLEVCWIILGIGRGRSRRIGLLLKRARRTGGRDWIGKAIEVQSHPLLQ